MTSDERRVVARERAFAMTWRAYLAALRDDHLARVSDLRAELARRRLELGAAATGHGSVIDAREVAWTDALKVANAVIEASVDASADETTCAVGLLVAAINSAKEADIPLASLVAMARLAWQGIPDDIDEPEGIG